jgi:serine phosphatase RsbU (regulator of sigma subunit)
MQMKGDKYSIGMLEPGKAVKYQNIEVDLQSGDLLYLFTDGYADQIGGEDGQEKLMLYRFREFLLLIKDQPMEMQKNLLDSYLEEWKNGNEQLDDILIVGFKIF